MRLRRFLLAAVCLALAPVAVLGQPVREYAPSVGQEGKDVIWVPTQQALVDKMLDLAKVAASDHVVDLGSGDGRTVITAARRGATAHGIEFNPDMVALSKRNAAKAGVTERATFAAADIFESDFSRATVVTMFLLPTLNLKLRSTILDMAPGTRVVSNSFDMSDWTPDETAHVTEGCLGYCRAYLWVVPAKVAGRWQIETDRPEAGELMLQQGYQLFTGMLTTSNVVAPVKDGKLAGDRITFSAGDHHYSARVNGEAMEGVAVAGGTEAKWRAVRR